MPRRLVLTLLLGGLAGLLYLLPGAPGRPTSPAPGPVVSDFTLPDHHGKPHSLGDLRDTPVVVLAFLTCDCPIANLYAPRLVELARATEHQGVAFLAVSSGPQDTLSSLAAFRRRHALPFPVLKDNDQLLAGQLGVKRTPEVLVLDAGRHVRYRGRIDDQYAPGKRRPKVSRPFLSEALQDVLADRPVRVPRTEPVGCQLTQMEQADPSAEITWARDVAAIVYRRCTPCHRPGQAAPFALTSYKETASWAGMIREVVADGTMPPWFASPRHSLEFRNEARLTPREKETLLAWLDAGCPEGEARLAPAPPSFLPDWRIPRPDRVLALGEQATLIPAEGEVEYRYFTVDPGFTEDVFVRAAEVRPGNPAVVHHALVLLQRPGGDMDDPLGALLDYAPGMPALDLPAGYALRVPAGSKFVFQMHYTPNGSPQEDLTTLGLVFADPRTVKHELRGGAVVNTAVDIPPGARDYRLSAEQTLQEDALLLSLSPHLHLRGKSFRVEAHFPDGKRRLLLDVPRYDFGWQLRYELAEPLLLPRGTKLVCHAAWDNSADNPTNPDPTQRVGWGDQTHDEMLIGFFSWCPALPRE